ncbi:transposase [Saccharopolyspora hattusasensis]|uniref:transposase n=1 Tax=Saccharopolyspora hattusasensis TaxID=1128679 RepID=UPI003D96F1BD
MSQTTVPAQLLGLDGVEIDVIEREADGSWTVHVTTAAPRAACCPGCGHAAERVRESTVHTVKHVTMVAMRVSWHKSRFWCGNAECGNASFVETGPLADRRAGISSHARTVTGHLVGDWLVPVSRVAAGVGMAWHTVHDAFVGVAAQAGIVVTDTTTTTDRGAGVACDAGPDRQDGETAGGGDPRVADADPGAVGTDLAARPQRSVGGGVLPPVAVLGIDDHRRGKPLYHRDRSTGEWVADADRWQTVFVDSAGGHGLLGQVEGRAGVDAAAWLAAQDPAWRAGITHVTIDMSTVYNSVVTTSGLLPHAALIVDAFHAVQLANTMVGDVRRRVTFEHYGRRGRATDPEYTIKNQLVRGKEKLSERARNKLLCVLADLGGYGRQIGAAWRAKELLRAVIGLSPNQTGVATTGHRLRRAFHAFFTFCGTIGASVPEIVTLAQTISTWRTEIARGVLTGHSNAAAEGVNRLVKLVYRGAFGFTNVTHQQRRSRYTASRSTRPEWLHTVNTSAAPCVVT